MTPHDTYFELAHIDGPYIARAYFDAGDGDGKRTAGRVIIDASVSVRHIAKQLGLAAQVEVTGPHRTFTLEV